MIRSQTKMAKVQMAHMKAIRFANSEDSIAACALRAKKYQTIAQYNEYTAGLLDGTFNDIYDELEAAGANDMPEGYEDQIADIMREASLECRKSSKTPAQEALVNDDYARITLKRFGSSRATIIAVPSLDMSFDMLKMLVLQDDVAKKQLGLNTRHLIDVGAVSVDSRGFSKFDVFTPTESLKKVKVSDGDSLWINVK